MEEHDLMTAAEAAHAFGVRPETVARWIKAGKLEAIRTPGGQYRLRRSVVEAALGGGQ